MKTTVTTSVGGKQITLETGRLAKQADGAVLASCGNNMVLVTAASRNEWVFAEGGNLTLARNDILKTFTDGQADLVIPGLYHIRLKNDSEIKLAKAPSRAFVESFFYLRRSRALISAS